MPEQRTNGGLSGSLPTENAAMGFRPKNIYIYIYFFF